MLANASLSQDDDRTLERVKSQRSLVVHWHRSETATVRAPLRFNEMKMDNVSGVSIVSAEFRSVEQYSVCIVRTHRSGLW